MTTRNWYLSALVFPQPTRVNKCTDYRPHETVYKLKHHLIIPAWLVSAGPLVCSLPKICNEDFTNDWTVLDESTTYICTRDCFDACLPPHAWLVIHPSKCSSDHFRDLHLTSLCLGLWGVQGKLWRRGWQWSEGESWWLCWGHPGHVTCHYVSSRYSLMVSQSRSQQMSLFPFWRTSLGQVYNWLSERVYSGCWCMEPGLPLSACVVSIWGLVAHDWPECSIGPRTGIARSPRSPALSSAQDTPVNAAHSLNPRPSPSLTCRARARPSSAITKAMLQFPQGWPCVIGKCCHLPLTFDISLITHEGHEWLCGACGCGWHPHVELITPHNFKLRPLFLEVMLETIKEGNISSPQIPCCLKCTFITTPS